MKQLMTLGVIQSQADSALHAATANGLAQRIWDQDTTLWKPNDPEAQRSEANRLGWLFAPEKFESKLHELIEFAAKVRQDGIRDVVLLGMGGSSLCVEVLRDVIGVQAGFPKMHVLDGTHPDQVHAIERAIDIRQTLFVVASKSGSTLESDCFYRYFWGKLEPLKGAHTGQNFIAITDSGSSLEKTAGDKRFRKTFINPSDIGGRFSALSYFGLVPAALMGIDIRLLMERAGDEAELARADDESNLPLRLGVALATAGQQGRDKITLIAPPAFQSFGYWAEQLVAESTGKEGQGLLPIEGEHPLKRITYGEDRLFVYFQLGGSSPEELEKYPGPIVHIHLSDAYDLGAQFFRWEFATAAAGALMGINPFDEPNVTESKIATNEVLKEFETSGALPTIGEHGDMKGFLKENAVPGKYIAILCYLAHTPELERELGELRQEIEERYRCAVTVGFGPRYLHSTGQLHKGGPNTGAFILFTDEPHRDLAIPGKPFGFKTLVHAQAAGDLQALRSKGKQVLSVNLGAHVSEAIRHTISSIR